MDLIACTFFALARTTTDNHAKRMFLLTLMAFASLC